MVSLENYFEQFRKNIVGIDAEFETPYGIQKLLYADWIASGRMYAPIEDLMKNKFGPMVGNTHSEASETGVIMTNLYHEAKQIIKKHVNASEDDYLITEGSGMTGAALKLQRLLGLKVPDRAKKYLKDIPEEEKPVVFVTYMEHHSNHISWLETIADVIVLLPEDDEMNFADELEKQLLKYKNRKIKIGSFTAGSNVTGIIPDYHILAGIMHKHGGYAFVDFAASAPYIKMDMHPENKLQYLDAVFFSPHKALGGPGSSGVLIFNKKLYQKKQAPDHPGGGTVIWTNRWNEFAYFDDVELREDGGTPAFLQTMRIALTLKLKEKMGISNITEREHQLLDLVFSEFHQISGLHILADKYRERIGAVSFYVDTIHHNLIVKLLNDRFGIQTRGGCSCAGPYGHYLLHVSKDESHRITDKINQGDLTEKPGWVRLSVHPTMTNQEVLYISDALKQIISNISEWEKDYKFDKTSGEFFHISVPRHMPDDYEDWFNM